MPFLWNKTFILGYIANAPLPLLPGDKSKALSLEFDGIWHWHGL